MATNTCRHTGSQLEPPHTLRLAVHSPYPPQVNSCPSFRSVQNVLVPPPTLHITLSIEFILYYNNLFMCPFSMPGYGLPRGREKCFLLSFFISLPSHLPKHIPVPILACGTGWALQCFPSGCFVFIRSASAKHTC